MSAAISEHLYLHTYIAIPITYVSLDSPLEMYSKFVLAISFGWPNPDIVRKMADGQLLFQPAICASNEAKVG